MKHKERTKESKQKNIENYYRRRVQEIFTNESKMEEQAIEVRLHSTRIKTYLVKIINYKGIHYWRTQERNIYIAEK